MNPDSAVIEFAGHQLRLLPSGAVCSPAHQVLWVADVHLGKAASYRRLGQPVPRGTTTQTLAQLSADINQNRIKHLIVLGDFLHGPLVHQATATLGMISLWRTQHAACEITLIRGNHDDRAGDPPVNLDIRVVDEPFEFASIACCHDVDGLGLADHVFAMGGHLHPVAVVYGKARERLRLPTFVVSRRRILLPAYGAFTGGMTYRAASDESLYVIAGQSVFKLPKAQGVGAV